MFLRGVQGHPCHTSVNKMRQRRICSFGRQLDMFETSDRISSRALKFNIPSSSAKLQVSESREFCHAERSICWPDGIQQDAYFAVDFTAGWWLFAVSSGISSFPRIWLSCEYYRISLCVMNVSMWRSCSRPSLCSIWKIQDVIT